MAQATSTIPQPFKQPFKLMGRQPMKHSAYSDLRDEVMQSFPLITRDDLDTLLPKKQKCCSERLSNNVYLYGIDADEPLFFRTELTTGKTKGKKGDESGVLVPTVYALWRVPSMLPHMYTYQPLVPKISGVNCTSLFLPGVWCPELPDAFFSRHTEPITSYAELFDVSGKMKPKTISEDSKSNDAFPPYMSPSSFDFNFKPGQLRSVHVLGHPYAIGVGIVDDVTLQSALDFAVSAAKTKSYTPAWPSNPWPSTWPPACIADSSTDKSVKVKDLAVSAGISQFCNDVIPFLSSEGETDISVPQSDFNTIKQNYPDFSGYSLRAYWSTPLETRPIGRGNALNLLHTINDTLFTHAGVKHTPKDGFFSTSGSSISVVPHDKCALVWRQTLALLRAAWLNCIANEDAPLVDAQDEHVDDEDDDEDDDDMVADVEAKKKAEADNLSEEDGLTPYTHIDTNNAENTNTQTLMSADEMSRRIEWALLFLIKNRLDDETFPLQDSAVYKLIRACSYCPSILYTQSDDADSVMSQFSLVPLDISLSTHRKLGTLLKHANKQGWLTVKTLQSGATVVTSIDSNCSDVSDVSFNGKDTKALKTTEKQLASGLGIDGAGGSNKSAVSNSDGDDDITALVKVVQAVRVSPQLHSFLTSHCSEYQFNLPEDDDDDEESSDDDGQVNNNQAQNNVIKMAVTCYDSYMFEEHRVTDMKTLSSAIGKYIKTNKLTVTAPVPNKQNSRNKKSFDSDSDDEYADYNRQSKSSQNQKQNPEAAKGAIPHIQADAALTTALSLNNYKPKNVKGSDIVSNPYAHLPLYSELGAILNRCIDNVYTTCSPVVAAVAKAAHTGKMGDNGADNVSASSIFASMSAVFKDLCSPAQFMQFTRAMKKCKWSAGLPPTLSISVTQIKSKVVTLIVGFERFGILPSRVVNESGLKAYLACAVSLLEPDSSVRSLLGVALDAKTTHIISTQGDQESRVTSYLINKLGIDKNLIQVYRKGKLIK